MALAREASRLETRVQLATWCVSLRRQLKNALNADFVHAITRPDTLDGKVRLLGEQSLGESLDRLDQAVNAVVVPLMVAIDQREASMEAWRLALQREDVDGINAASAANTQAVGRVHELAGTVVARLDDILGQLERQ